MYINAIVSPVSKVGNTKDLYQTGINGLGAEGHGQQVSKNRHVDFGLFMRFFDRKKNIQ